MPRLFLCQLFLLSLGAGQEEPTPASLLGPRNYNYHAYQPDQTLDNAEPTKQGPVLFPNDAPPPPRPPLVVTSRPIEESIARSELNQEPQNNSIAEQSQINKVAFKPQFLARIKNYRPFVAQVATPNPYRVQDLGSYPVDNYQNQVYETDQRYEDYEEHPTLPPIYKVLSDYANQRVLSQKVKQKPVKVQKQAVRERDDYTEYNNDVKDYDDYHNQGHNYAFSYTVRDHKTGDDFSHSQQSSGSATNGEYRVRLPDGRMQVVSYTADENGYKADVRYDDEEKKDNTLEYNAPRNAPVNNYAASKDIVQYNINSDIAKHLANKHLGNYNLNHGPVDYNDRQAVINEHNRQQQQLAYNNQRIEENREIKPVIENPIQSDYQYGDSKEYNEDYSLEYGKDYGYEPHRSKFVKFAPKYNKGVVFIPRKAKQQLRPSYAELKPLFIQKPKLSAVSSTANYLYSKIPIELNVPSTTPSFEPTTTERIVLIGGKQPLYTNIRPSLFSPTASPTPLSLSNFRSSTPVIVSSPQSTPSNFLASTIATLRKNVDLSGPKPVFSSSFIDRINKYLSFK